MNLQHNQLNTTNYKAIQTPCRCKAGLREKFSQQKKTFA